MTNINPNAFTTRPEIEGTFGVVTTTHWIATAVGMGILEKGGNAFDAAVATAFTLQVVEPHLNGPGGDVPVILYDVRRGKPEVICGQGVGAGRRHHRALSERRSRSRARHRASRRLRARHVRDLDAAVARLRHDAACRGAGAGDRLCAERPSAARARQRHHRHRRRACFASIGRPRRRSICRTIRCRPTGTLFTNKTFAATYSRIIREAESAGGDRVAQIERARQSWSPRLCRRSHRPLLPHPGDHGHQRRAASRRADRRRHGALDAARRSAADLRLRRLHGVQDRPLGPGPGDAAAARAAQGFRSRRGSIRPGRISSTPSSNAPSSLTPTAKCSTAIRISSKCRWRRCCRMPTIPSAASSSPTRLRSNSGPARSRVSAPW